MAEKNVGNLVEKYGDVIAEELNVKSVEFAGSSEGLGITTVVKVSGSAVSERLGKNTGRVIGLAKQGNFEFVEEGVVVRDPASGEERKLFAGDFVVENQGDVGANAEIERDFVVVLDTEIDEELRREGVAREISRFLNQMRKTADLELDARIRVGVEAGEEVSGIVRDFEEFLKNETLAVWIRGGSRQGALLTENFVSELGDAVFSLGRADAGADE